MPNTSKAPVKLLAPRSQTEWFRVDSNERACHLSAAEASDMVNARRRYFWLHDPRLWTGPFRVHGDERAILLQASECSSMRSSCQCSSRQNRLPLFLASTFPRPASRDAHERVSPAHHHVRHARRSRIHTHGCTHVVVLNHDPVCVSTVISRSPLPTPHRTESRGARTVSAVPDVASDVELTRGRPHCSVSTRH